MMYVYKISKKCVLIIFVMGFSFGCSPHPSKNKIQSQVKKTLNKISNSDSFELVDIDVKKNEIKKSESLGIIEYGAFYEVDAVLKFKEDCFWPNQVDNKFFQCLSNTQIESERKEAVSAIEKQNYDSSSCRGSALFCRGELITPDKKAELIRKVNQDSETKLKQHSLKHKGDSVTVDNLKVTLSCAGDCTDDKNWNNFLN